MDCFASLAMTGIEFPYSHGRNFLARFVDGIFTTFIQRAFTNTFNAIGQKSAVYCV